MIRRTAAMTVGILLLTVGIEALAQERPTPNIPNLLIEVTRDFANAAASAQPVDQVSPIDEKKGRLHITGMQHTRAVVGVEFVPNANGAVVDLLLNGGTAAETKATQGKVDLFLTTRVSYAGSKRICIDVNGVHDLSPANACPQLDENTLNCLQTRFRGPLDPLVSKIAYRVYEKKKPQVDRDILRGARQQGNEQFDKTTCEQLARANERYQRDLREPMVKRGVFPQKVLILSSSDQIGIRALLNDPTGATRTFAPVPEITGNPDVAVRVEESLLNNATHAMFSGKKMTGEDLEKEFNALMKPIAGDIKMADPGEKPFSITFAKAKPIEIHFDKQAIRVTLRGVEFTSGDAEYDGMDTTAIYKLAKKGRGVTAERQGDLQIYPPGFVPGKDKLGAREQVLRKLLERKFGRVLKPKLEMETFELPEGMEQVGEIAAAQLEANNGWFVLTLERVGKK